MARCFILGITGGTGSGKSWLAQRLSQLFKNQVTVLHTDWYYHDQNAIRGKARLDLNFDHPRALETSLIVRHLQDLQLQRRIQAPQYDYARHQRKRQTIVLDPKPLVIVEGLFVLHEDRIRRQLHHSVFLDIPGEERLAQRLRRDLATRNLDLEETLRLYQTFAQPMYKKFVQPSQQWAVETWDELPDSRRISSLARRIRKQLA